MRDGPFGLSDRRRAQWLDCVRVIDFGLYQPSPRCSMILGDLGAEVIKVEAAPDGDE
jgi:crotonobetainyl-CoA:carnitine CoA-transferase CaiB-like acyl-CoA transferase